LDSLVKSFWNSGRAIPTNWNCLVFADEFLKVGLQIFLYLVVKKRVYDEKKNAIYGLYTCRAIGGDSHHRNSRWTSFACRAGGQRSG
jgi:hypothetical protein